MNARGHWQQFQAMSGGSEFKATAPAIWTSAVFLINRKHIKKGICDLQILRKFYPQRTIEALEARLSIT
jgi:hypothetical protein